jgi:hypothetical protein
MLLPGTQEPRVRTARRGRTVLRVVLAVATEMYQVSGAPEARARSGGPAEPEVPAATTAAAREALPHQVAQPVDLGDPQGIPGNREGTARREVPAPLALSEQGEPLRRHPLPHGKAATEIRDHQVDMAAAVAAEVAGVVKSVSS